MNNHDRTTPEPQAPPRLRADLARLYQPPRDGLDALDDAVLAAASRHIDRHTRRRSLTLGSIAGVAAVLLLAAAWWMFLPASPRPPAPAPASEPLARAAAPGAPPLDIDDSGAVDILDALALARRLRAGGPAPSAPDLNADGVVDNADALLLADRAVSLSRSTL